MRKILIFLMLMVSVAFCQVNDMERMTAELSDIEKQIATISDSPVKFANDRIAELDEWIRILPDRKPIEEGNITMKQALQNLKKEINDDTGKYVSDVLTELHNEKKRLTTGIERVK